MTYEDYESFKYDALMTTTIWYYGGQKDKIPYDNLFKEISYMPEKYKSIMNGLTHMYKNEFNMKYRNMLEDMSNANMKKWADNHEWYSSMVVPY